MCLMLYMVTQGEPPAHSSRELRAVLGRTSVAPRPRADREVCALLAPASGQPRVKLRLELALVL